MDTEKYLNDEYKKQNLKKSIIKIIGTGNIYMSDDAVGIKIIEEIKKRNIFKDNENIEIIDGGTSGLDLIFEFQTADKVIIIDAVDAGQSVGEIVLLDAEDIMNQNIKTFASMSLHDIGLLEVFGIYRSLNLKTKIKIIGIMPKTIGQGDKLSKEIDEKIEEMINKVIETVNLI